jgi:hypothetical protein
MEVAPFPTLPGIGTTAREAALLPQHARHCSVLEAGSALGFLVHP